MGETIRFVATLQGKALVLTGGQLEITKNVTIDGASGTPGGQITIDANQASRVLAISGNQADVKLNHLVITNGRSPGQPGGGILVGKQSSLTIADSVLTLNRAGDENLGASGGGIFAEAGTELMLERTTVISNDAARTYAADHNGYAGGYGGGIAAQGVKLLNIRDSIITNNTGAFGGGVSIDTASVSNIENSEISQNMAFHQLVGGGGGGGGLVVRKSNVNISSCSISKNKSGSVAGGIFSFNGSLPISDSTIAGNNAKNIDLDPPSGFGGAIWSSGAVLILKNSTITGNSSGLGFGRFAEGGGIAATTGHRELHCGG